VVEQWRSVAASTSLRIRPVDPDCCPQLLLKPISLTTTLRECSVPLAKLARFESKDADGVVCSGPSEFASPEPLTRTIVNGSSAQTAAVLTASGLSAWNSYVSGHSRARFCWRSFYRTMHSDGRHPHVLPRCRCFGKTGLFLRLSRACRCTPKSYRRREEDLFVWR
jgi:hypothetical protein